MDHRALHKIGYGLYIVCSRKGKRFNGQTANTTGNECHHLPSIHKAFPGNLYKGMSSKVA